ncbi:hypothetical protein EV421DRAFT_548313 [Armillaria borealis]|uniref:Cytochrome P450 n=1 Tax=Armillaria borealis TaxID=47425 RepID=A0AA39MPZ7_9AGAR|nr:hypothetical protein EV421DRAFT_548313 [Armillaria borealis]
MHLALAIFLSGLVIFLHPLRAALSWVICAGTVLVYTAYVVATILPILFPQCPYRTPLCDLVYISVCCTILARVTWESRWIFLYHYRRRDFSRMFRYRPRVQARTPQSLTMIESEFVQQRSKDLAVEALHWLFSVSSNPSVQSIVIQSVGGLPMASGSMVTWFQVPGDNGLPMLDLRDSLIRQCLLETKVSDHSYYEPVPGMEGKLGRLLRFGHGQPVLGYRRSFIYTPNIYSFDLTAAILSNGGTLCDRETLNESVTPGAFLMDNTRSKLSPSSWYSLMLAGDYKVLRPLDPNHANMFPLHLCSAILKSFARLPDWPVGLTQEFDSPLALDFEDALPYFIDKIHHVLLSKFSESIEDQSSVDEPSSPKSLRVLVLAIKFLLDRLSLPDYEMSHTTIRESLALVTGGMWRHTFLSLEEATVFMPVLEDIIARCLVPPLNIDSDDPGQGSRELWKSTLFAYGTLTRITPSACSLHGLQSTVDFMTRHWDQTGLFKSACNVFIPILQQRIPVAFTVFCENKCLEFLGDHVFLSHSVWFVSAYIAGVFAMQCRSDVDAATHQLHIDYLHNPDNLFTACSILAI